MEKVKKYSYSSIIAIFIITAITSVLEYIYMLSENDLKINFLPESVWDFLDGYFYYEALPFRNMIMMAVFVFLSILILLFYRKNISKVTIILLTTTPIVSAIGWTAPFWLREITDKGKIVFIIIAILSIIHTVVTGVFLIKDKEEFDYI